MKKFFIVFKVAVILVCGAIVGYNYCDYMSKVTIVTGMDHQVVNLNKAIHEYLVEEGMYNYEIDAIDLIDWHYDHETGTDMASFKIYHGFDVDYGWVNLDDVVNWYTC